MSSLSSPMTRPPTIPSSPPITDDPNRQSPTAHLQQQHYIIQQPQQGNNQFS